MLADTTISLSISLSLSIFTTQPQDLARELQGAVDGGHPGGSGVSQEERLAVLILLEELCDAPKSGTLQMIANTPQST
jgi:hypothetical protein